MFRLMSYILNSKLIDDSSNSNVNAEHSSSSQSETYAESDTQEEENSEVDDKLTNSSSSSEKESSPAKPTSASLKKKKEKLLPLKKKLTMNVSKTKEHDGKDQSGSGDATVKSTDDKEKLKTEKHKLTQSKLSLSKTKASELDKSKTRIDFPKKEVKSEKKKDSTEDEDDVPLKKLKRTNSKEVLDSISKKEKEMTETKVDKTINDVATSPKKRQTNPPSKDIDLKKGKFKVVQPKRYITKPVIRKAVERPVSLPLKNSSSRSGEPPQKKPQSEIERLKELEAQMAVKKPKLKITKNIVQELKEKDELLLKAKIGELFKEESIRSSLNESKSDDDPVTLQPPAKLLTSEAASSTSYEDAKSPSTFASCVSPCFSEESRPSATASHKDESNDGFNESIERSISPSNSESTVTGNEGQRSRSRKRSVLGKPKKKSASNSRRSSRSVSEDGSVIETPSKITKRIPKRPGIIFNIGCKLEAMDFQQKWYMAKIIEIDQEKAEILIHFDGWSSRYDEWISMHSKKLRAVAQPKPGKKDPKEKTCQFKAGEKVLARWSDNKMYPAVIKESQPENFYLVEFFDGFAKKLSYSCIAKVPTELVEKLTHPLPLAAVKKLQAEEEISNDPLLKNILNRSSTDDDSNLNSPSSDFVPKKQFKVEEDHNQFKCHYENCNKSFRKETLLASHIKHYHRPPKPKITTATPKKKKVPLEKTSTVSPIPNPLSSTSESTTPIVKTEVAEEPKNDEIKMELDENTLPSTEVEDADSVIIKDENQPKPTTLDDKLLPETIANLDKTPITIPPKFITGKGIYPITKMETRHAKLRFQKDDSVYTNYKNVALGIQRPRRVSECKPDKAKAIVRNEKTVARPKHNSESSARGSNVRARLSESKKNRRNRGERKNEDGVSKGEVKKPKLEKDEDTQEKREGAGLLTTRKRSDRYSESTCASKTDEAVKDDLEDVTDMGEDPNDDKEESKDDEVVHCICEINEENGLMIQCEVCMTWQHGSCFSIEEIEQVPDKYICYACTNPRGLRRSFKYKLDQEFFKSGELPTFNEMGTNCKQSCSILAAHELVSSMHNIVNVLHSLDYKINLTKDGVKDNSDLKYFSKPWKKLSASNESLNESTLTAKSNNLDAELTLDAETTERVLKAIADEGISDPKEALIDETFMNSLKSPESARGFTTLDHSYFSVQDNNPASTGKLLEISEIEDIKAQQDRANLNSACSSTDSTTATTTTTTEDTDADFVGVSAGVTSVFPEDMSDSEPELNIPLGDRNPLQVRSKTATKGKSGGFIGSRKRGRTRRNYFGHQTQQVVEHIPKVEENYDTEAAKENILNHISDVQLNLENKLDLIEGQLKILEAEYGEDPSDQDQYGVDSEDDDFPKLLQSIKNLSKDLTLVERLAVL